MKIEKNKLKYNLDLPFDLPFENFSKSLNEALLKYEEIHKQTNALIESFKIERSKFYEEIFETDNLSTELNQWYKLANIKNNLKTTKSEEEKTL